MNLIGMIRDAIWNDDIDEDDQSAHLRRAWETANPEEREKLDEAFIALCGWSLTKLVQVES